MIRKFEITVPVKVGKKTITSTLEFSRTQAGNFRTGEGSMHILDLASWFLDDETANPTLILTGGEAVLFRLNGQVSAQACAELVASIPTEDLERCKAFNKLLEGTKEVTSDTQETVQ